MKTRNIVVYKIISMLQGILVAYLFIKYKIFLYHFDDIDKWIISLIACNYIYFFSIISFESKTKKDKIIIILLHLIELIFVIISSLFLQWFIMSFIIIRISIIFILFKKFSFKYNKGIKIMERKEMAEWQRNKYIKQSQILFISGIYIYILTILTLIPLSLLINGYLKIEYFWIVFIYIISVISIAYLIKYIKAKEPYSLTIKQYFIQICIPIIVIIIYAIFYKIAEKYNFQIFLGYIFTYSIVFDFIFVERERLARLFYLNKNKII